MLCYFQFNPFLSFTKDKFAKNTIIMLKKLSKTFLSEVDIFKTPALLRYRQKTHISNFKFAIISLFLFIFFAYLFVQKTLSMVNLHSHEIISSSVLRTNNDTTSVKNVMFAISYQYGDMSIEEISNYFEMNAFIVNNTGGILEWVKVQMVPCKEHHWNYVGSNYSNYFLHYKYYCLPQVINALTAQYEKNFLKIQFSKCNSRPSCKSSKQINKLYKNILNQYSFFPIYIAFMNSQAQVYKKVSMKNKIDTLVYYVTQDISQKVFLKFHELKIYTNISVLPLHHQIEQERSLSFKEMSYAFEEILNSTRGNKLLSVQLSLTSNELVYYRSVAKIDNALSYIGGMFGIIVIILIFLLRSYNLYKYQLYVGDNSFTHHNDDNKMGENNLSILKYLKYRFYNTVYLIFGRKLSWRQCTQIQETVFEAKKILDVEGIYRRLDVMEKLLWNKFNADDLLMMTLQKPGTIQIVNHKRLTLQYYQQIIQLKQAITIEKSIKILEKQQVYISDFYHSQNQSQKQVNSIKISSQTSNQNKSPGMQRNFILHNLKNLLKMHQLSEQCQIIADHIQQYLQAQQILPAYKYDTIERQITNSFINLKPMSKKKLIRKIPIKIIYRLMIKAKQMQEQNNQVNEVDEGSRNRRGSSATIKEQLNDGREIQQSAKNLEIDIDII